MTAAVDPSEHEGWMRVALAVADEAAAAGEVPDLASIFVAPPPLPGTPPPIPGQ